MCCLSSHLGQGLPAVRILFLHPSDLPFPQQLGEPKYVLPRYPQAPTFFCHPLFKSVVPDLFGTSDQFPGFSMDQMGAGMVSG